MESFALPGPAADYLTQLQLQVARRADELARLGRGPGSLNLYAWLVAEAEIFGCDGQGNMPRAVGFQPKL